MASGLLTKKNREDMSSEPSVMVGEPRSINELPNEILLKILSHFGIEDLCLIFAKVCKRWKALSKEVIIWKKMSYRCNHTSDISRVVQVLTVAPALQSLIIREREDVTHIMETLSDSPVVLKNLILNRCQFGKDGPGILANIAALYPDLEVLSLEGCQPIASADYSIISRLKKLSELNLSCCEELLGETVRLIVDSCQHLKKLNLYGMFRIPEDVVIHIINKLGKQLTTLVLDGVDLTDAEYLYLKNCASLQELWLCCYKITDRGLLEGIGSLQKLTSLRLIDGNELTDQALCAFLDRPSMASIVALHLTYLDNEVLRVIAKRCVHLKELAIGHGDDPVTEIYHISDDAVSTVIRHCNQLRILNLKGVRDISGEGSLSLVPAHLPHLRLLCLEQCSCVSKECIDMIVAAAPELVVINDLCDIVGGMIGEMGIEPLTDDQGMLISHKYDILRQWALDE